MSTGYLPKITFGAAGFTRGRNVREGYTRGWGMLHTDLMDKIQNDPLYIEARLLAGNRSVMSLHNQMNIFLILRFYLSNIPVGNIIEFGAYRGGNAIFMAYLAKRLFGGKVKVFALDTYQGMPETDTTIDAHRSGDFSDVDLDELQSFAQTNRLDNLIFVKGLFEDTAPKVLYQNGPFSLAHIDCDIRSAVAYSYEVVKPYMVSGGYYVFDDATYPSCIGATEAVEDIVIKRDGLNSEQIFPHFVFRAPVKE
jgi:predicted O-methyltransferase YrrM